MDCMHVQELLSENADGRAVPMDQLAAARAHCDGCPQCAAFERGLALLAAAGAPSAPAGLVESILESVSATAADAKAISEDLIDGLRPHTHARERRPSWWIPRLATFAGAAAAIIVIAAVTVTTIGFTGGLKQLDSQDDRALELATDEQAEDRAAVAESEPTATNDTAGTMASSPPYVSINGLVYLADAPVDVVRSRLVTVGPVDGRSIEGTDAPAYAYRIGTDERGVVIEEAAGWMTFGPVIRRFAGGDYQLATGTPITDDGVWPSLPSTYPVPAAADGSPTFRFFGYDDLGVEIYVPASGSEEDGFAVAPGTASDDPAAGNPDWTWWVPLP